jgi:hypothetical protein
MRRGALLLLVGLALRLAGVPPADAQESPEEPLPSPSPGWTTTTTVRGVGRGVAIPGNDPKYREDYDALESGGGGEATVSAYDAEGRYLELQGSVFGQSDGRTVDGGEVHLRGGQWGRYSIAGDLVRTQAFYDDSYDGPAPASFPFTDTLDRELSTARTTGRLALEWLFGTRGRAGVVYRHDENDGDRSMIKGSRVESLAPFAFRFPAFQDLDVRSDAVDVEASLPAGPLAVVLSAGYTDERDRTTTNETNFGAIALNERTRFHDDVKLQLVRAGVDVATPLAWPVVAHAGYRFLYADADAEASKSAGESGSVLLRTADGISVQDRSHAGHIGTVFTPARGLVVRTAYTVLDQNRNGAGTELRRLAPGGDVAQPVRDTSAKNLLRQRPRLEVTYAGLPRTLLRARYAFEHGDRDFDDRMTVQDAVPLVAADQVERTSEDQDLHVVTVEGRIRVLPRLLLGTGYEYRHEDVDEHVKELVNETTLGDRTRSRNTVFAQARLRADRRTTVELRGEYQSEDFDRTDVAGNSTTSVDAEIVTLRAVSALTARLMLTGLFSFANRDQDVGTPRRVLSFFRSQEFRGRSTSGALGVVYSLDERTTAQAHYTVVDDGGSLDNVNNRVFASVGRRVGDHLRIALGYAFLQFDQGLFSGDDYDAHLAWTSVTLGF